MMEELSKALELFGEYFRQNYPGPRTVISDPDWHSPKIFNAVLSCLREANVSGAPGGVVAIKTGKG